MAFWDITVSAEVVYQTTVEAETEDEARDIAMSNWQNCEDNEMEFYNEHISDIFEIE